MNKPHELMDNEVEQSPVLQALLERARASGQLLVAYRGIVFSITPVEDLTHTFTPEELKEFAADYTAAEEPSNHLTVEQALIRHQQRKRRNG